MEKACGGSSSNGLAWEKPLTLQNKKKKGVGGRHRLSSLFSLKQFKTGSWHVFIQLLTFSLQGPLKGDGAKRRENQWRLEIEFYRVALVCKNESILILPEPLSAQTTYLHPTIF